MSNLATELETLRIPETLRGSHPRLMIRIAAPWRTIA
jgi:hypothetical protein